MTKAFYFTIGSCRGSGFRCKGTIDLDEMIKKAEACPADEIEDLLMEHDMTFNGLFESSHNCCRADEAFRQRFLKLCKTIKKRKRMIEVWEEGTTGISVLPNGYDKKALITEVKCVDRDAMDGEDVVSDVSDLFKKEGK